MELTPRTSLTILSVSFVTRRTRPTLRPILRVPALYSRKTGPIGTSFPRSAFVSVAYVTAGTRTASGAIGRVVALCAGEAPGRISGARFPFLVAEIAFFQETDETVNGVGLFGYFVV